MMRVRGQQVTNVITDMQKRGWIFLPPADRDRGNYFYLMFECRG